MRVLQVAHRFVPGYLAGVEVYAAALSQGLHARGHAVQVFAGDPNARQPHTRDWEGLRVDVAPWGVAGRAGPVATFLAGFGNPRVERQFTRVLDDFRPEVVHVHHLMGLSPRLPGLARRQGARVVITLHDYWFACSNTWLFRHDRQRCAGPGWGYHCAACALHRLGRRPQPGLMLLAAPLFAARTARLRRALLSADCLVAPSRVVAHAFEQLGVPAGRLRVIPHGALTAPAPAPAPAPQAANGPVRFLLVGSLIPPKGVHVAVEAFNALPAGAAELHVFGDPTADPGYVAELRRLARHPGIAFKGVAPREAVPGLLRAADVLLLPSLWDEPYSLVLDEAAAAGLALLVSDAGAPAERVRPGETGLVAAAGDVAAWRAAMQRLVDDGALRQRLRAAHPARQPMAAHLDAIEAVYRG